MDNETIAGIKPWQANRALAEWLNGRTNKRIICHGAGAKTYFSEMDTGHRFYWFSLRHDSIHRVLDAMNNDERKAYVRQLTETFLPEMALLSRVEMECLKARGLAMFATPAQKCEAALRALRLNQ